MAKATIKTLPKQTQKEMHDFICENMGLIGFITVNTGQRFMTKFDPLHKQQVYVGWIIRVELSKDQHILCECEKVKKTIVRNKIKYCTTCNKQIYEPNAKN